MTDKESRFTYKQRVLATRGFFRGLSFLVRKYDRRTDQYEIKTKDGEVFWIKEDDLEAY